jgi:hypothetical protein
MGKIHIVDGFFLFLIVSAVVCVVVQALMPVSRGNGEANKKAQCGKSARWV